ncbi:MAG: hypothetical protein J0I17_03435 ['Candidatus Kapabacteria' thiocyanatum]|uniref:Outer membrane protein beta-barrel domain-containing protein n=1 Tax=Candidatus Kapaibacterium thiocyanatum TaxID=1895771 RepID=A0A1M3KY74_9BACT|nr:hypothetical protein ['Candidatus Kapabacteria' thiocyanatum]OJX57204.1 MAG: hypothetical protein BGO89_11965 ['Candidatus Kapabacteria' thiocyanatum]
MRRLVYFVLLLIFGSAGIVTAQQELADPLIPAKSKPRIYVGPVAGYNRSLHSSGFQSVAGDVLCPDFTTGTANGYYFGMSAEYLLGRPKDSKSSIIARVIYNNLPANYRVDGDRLPSVDENQNIVYSTVQHVAEIKYSLIDIEAIYKLNLFNSNFGVVVGPTVGIPISVSREQRMELIEPLNATFDPSLFPPGSVEYVNGGRAIVTGRDNIPDRAGVRVAIKAGAQYEMPIGRLLLVPCIYYNFGITEVSPSANLRINALQMGVDLRFAL